MARDYIINERIRGHEVRLIAADGKQMGVVPTIEALRMAREAGLDLILIVPNSSPPVARIANHGKLKYENAKHDKEARKSQKVSSLKEIKLSLKIGAHDLEVRAKKVRELLEKGHKIKLNMFFRGREMAHKDLGFKVINKMLEMIADVGQPESEKKQEGRSVVVLIAPK